MGGGDTLGPIRDPIPESLQRSPHPPPGWRCPRVRVRASVRVRVRLRVRVRVRGWRGSRSPGCVTLSRG